MKVTSAHIGELIKETRRSLGLTQEGLALAAGTGLRFIIDLEKGKATCQLQKSLTVLNTLGIQFEFHPGLTGPDRHDEKVPVDR